MGEKKDRLFCNKGSHRGWGEKWGVGFLLATLTGGLA